MTRVLDIWSNKQYTENTLDGLHLYISTFFFF